MKNDTHPKIGQTVFLCTSRKPAIFDTKTFSKYLSTPFIVDSVHDHGADITRSVVVVYERDSKKEENGFPIGPFFVANCKSKLGTHVIYDLTKTGCLHNIRHLVEQKRRLNFDRASADERRRGKLHILKRPMKVISNV